MTNFKQVNPKQSFPKLEEEILAFWKENRIFEESIETREGMEEFNFYDGPPFATGTPHYGHILAGTIKDSITRYQVMKGKKVLRVNGWDCHGLPIENIVEKKMNLNGKKDIENFGIYNFNEACRENVFLYVDEWKKTIERMGRFIDMDNSWKTMDLSFMESVWSVFKNIYDKGLVYESNRVVPYCPRCSTPLSNFETNQGYKDKQDKSITVKFKIKPNFSNGVIIRNSKGEILFGKRKTNGLFTIPGGKIEDGEDVLSSAIRELEEETGVTGVELKLFSLHSGVTNNGFWNEYIYIADVEDDIRFYNKEEDKFVEWKFMSLEELEKNINLVEWYNHIVIKQLKGEAEVYKEHSNSYVLAWTTTPWTLPANLGLAVGDEIEYSQIKDLKNNETYILATDRLKSYYKNEEDYELLKTYKGSQLVGISYEPMFDIPDKSVLSENSYKVISGHHVTTESGTGVVHIAPAFGEDDNLIGKKENLGFFSHIDETGKIINLSKDNGIFVFEFNELVIKELKEIGKVVQISTIDHSYPHCWRCDTPLIYKAIDAWYVRVEQIRDRMVVNNKKINWVPEIIKEGRFGKWIENARDWNISRNRYWGSAIPVWQSEDKKEEVCIGSIEELYNLNKEFGDITKVIFVRHGRTDYNEKGLMDYKGNANLTEVGKNQAIEIKEKLKNLHIDAVFSSPLSRCVDTISPLAKEKGLKINIVDDFTEINSPDLQDKEFSCKNYKWENGYGGGEKISEAYDRVSTAFKKIIEENKGKTIVICSHGDPIFLMRKLMTGVDYDTEKYTSGLYLENNPKYGLEKMFAIDYAYSKTCKQIDLHKHFVDDVFLVNKKSFKAKNVLGIHGFLRTDKVIDFLNGTRENLEKDGIKMDSPIFEIGENISYKNWEEKLDKMEISKFDAFICHSMGCKVAIEYILENEIKLDRLVLVSPSVKGSSRPEIIKFYSEMKNVNLDKLGNGELKNLVKEMIVISSKDDTIVNYEEGKELAKIIGANFIEVNGYGHFNVKECKILEGLVKYGAPLKRIPEVLDCWFESGAMPYRKMSEDNKQKISEDEKEGERMFIEDNKEEIDELTHKIIGIAMKVHNELGGGLEEKVYKKALKIMLEKNDLIVNEETKTIFQIEGEEVGYGKIDLVVNNIIVLELKSQRSTKPDYFIQLRKYLSQSDYKAGLLINFYNNRLEFHRFNKDYNKQSSDIFGTNLSSSNNLLTSSENILGHLPSKFPADFIAEGLDQTRGWFYTLLILGTALFDNTPFLNVIVNGIVLAEDGKKMSKSLKNYPDPHEIFDNYGADAMRFYLMNSPVVEAQDFRFSEIGVQEVVKKVILPLWNTYSFFTTYANIDNYEPETGNIYHARHGQVDNNLNGMMNGSESNQDLNETGIKETTQYAKQFALSGEKIDVIVSSSLNRVLQTAEIIAKEIGYKGEILIEEDLKEQDSGVLGGMTHDEIKKMALEKYGLQISSRSELRRFNKLKKYNQAEDVTEFDERVSKVFNKIREQYKGKNILIVGHAGTIRPISRIMNNLSLEEAHFDNNPPISNSVISQLQQRDNNLDKWIISELNKLIINVSNGLDSYDLQSGARPIVEFMDNLTNWYIRRSRRRFWKTENDGDKLQAYNTLRLVLIELSKVIAPFMPFVSDEIYKSLTNKKSVHLDFFPQVNNSLIFEHISEQMSKTQKIVNLGLAFRASRKIRVRQPLQSITIGEKLDDYYIEIIKDELNVKEVIILEDSSKIAKKICKPNAKLIGPKYGKDVQRIIQEAKNGNFEELEGGKIKVNHLSNGNETEIKDIILESNEYEMAFEKSDESLDIEAGFGMVIAMDSNISEELLYEGYSRDIVRFIQESRKEAGYNVIDRIQVELRTENGELRDGIGKFQSYIESETLSKLVDSLENHDLEKSFEVENVVIVVKLRKYGK